MPFNDHVFRAMVPAVAELWSKEQKKDFDAGHLECLIGRAARIMRGIDSARVLDQDRWKSQPN